MRFCLIYRIWALVLDLYLGDVIKGPIASIGPIFNPILGLRLGPAHLLFQTPSVATPPPQPLTKLAKAKVVSLLGSGVISTWLLRKGLISFIALFIVLAI